MLDAPLAILATLCALVALTEWLVRHTALRHAGTALLVIVLTAVVANLGLIPAGSTRESPVPVYDGIFAHVAPLSIFWLLLRVNLAQVLGAGIPILVLFLIGSVGTALGVLLGFWWLDTSALGALAHAIGGMFTATYTGGSVNFNALALHYDVVRAGNIYAGTVVVDNVLTAIWMVATIALPRLLARHWPGRTSATTTVRTVSLGIEEDTEAIHPLDLAVLLALGLGAVWCSNRIAEALAGAGMDLPPILVLTALALLLAQAPAVVRLRGSRVLGMFAVYLFLAVIGAFCDLRALGDIGALGVTLSLLALGCVAIHGALTFAAAALLRWDADLAAVASQANVGGGTSALALARSLGRDDLVLPAILIGALGNALGTFLGFWVAGILG